jgi:hypothetical protein
LVSKFSIKYGLISFCLITTSPGHTELRDPTKPATFVYTDIKDQVADELRLSAIWIAKSSKRVTINGITAKQNQIILDNVKIIQILPQSVIVNQNGQSRKLKLLQHTIKTR